MKRSVIKYCEHAGKMQTKNSARVWPQDSGGTNDDGNQTSRQSVAIFEFKCGWNMISRILNITIYLFIILTTTTVAAIPNGQDQTAATPGGGGGFISDYWNKTFGGAGYDWANSAVQTSDGGYIFAGGTTTYGSGDADVWLVKTDASGNTQWSKAFGGAGFDTAYSVQGTSDSGYIILGITDSSGNGWLDAYLIKVDSDGNMQWSRTFGGADNDNLFSARQTSEGGYILAGSTFSYGAGSDDAWLIKTDANGIQQWNQTFGGSGYDWAAAVHQTTDGYILTGGTDSYGAGSDDAWLIKTDSNGYQQWNRTFGGAGSDWAESMEPTSEGGYILAGLTPSLNLNTWNDALLIKTDANGNLQWNKTFGGAGDNRVYSVQQTLNGGYMLAGETNAYSSSYDAWLIKTDASGSQQWSKTFGGTDFDAAYSVQQTSDNGYILAGETFSYGAGFNDAWLIKISPPSSLSIAINNEIAYTNSISVVLNISAVSADEMSFSNDNASWSTWEPFASTKPWTLTSGDGLKTVHFKARNGIGEAVPVNDTIILDTKPPGVTNATANQSVIPDDTDYIPLWGEIARLTLTATDDSGIGGVTVNLSEIGGSPAKPMINIGGNIWSTTTNASAGTPPKLYDLTVNATDISGNSNKNIRIQIEVMKNGDTTGDGSVNIGDSLRLANNISYPGDARYALSSIYVAEVTGDGKIDIGDALRLANNVSYSGDTRYMLK